ncbi:MAG: DUF4058 family protein [Nostoc sp. DedQUE01]|nr:DUF4058 family protein [Nostoc sp. DedQUE01]
MHNPFFGMNPYLEEPELWYLVHKRLIIAMSDDKLLRIYADNLTPQIAPTYRVLIEERVYTSVDDGFLLGIPDIAIAKRNSTNIGTTLTSVKPAELTTVIHNG